MGGAGIIPARAGFTSPTATAQASAPGSSPLARGLLLPVLLRRLISRIIPARAGFTPPRTAASPASRDHPRSRGVYSRRGGGGCGHRGSSPLARGLPQSACQVSSQSGIIPARAGFTRPGRASRSRCPDHPRSRGVYPSRLTQIMSVSGSSPLARGLPDTRMMRPGNTRIIPARAGFTSVDEYATGRLTDHPRSRGVYFRGRSRR